MECRLKVGKLVESGIAAEARNPGVQPETGSVGTSPELNTQGGAHCSGTTAGRGWGQQ